MANKISKVIVLLVLLSVFSVALFDGVTMAASSGTMLQVTYLSQITPEQWVAQWYEHQKEASQIITAMNCGPATLVMLEAYFKQTEPTPERILEVDEFIYDQLSSYQGKNPKTYTRPPVGYEYTGPAEGVNTADMKVILSEFMGFEHVVLKVGQSIQDIKDYLDAGSPVIIPVNRIYGQKSNANVYHFTLVYGYDEENFYCNDPGKPEAIGIQATFTHERLAQIWQPGTRILTVEK